MIDSHIVSPKETFERPYYTSLEREPAGGLKTTTRENVESAVYTGGFREVFGGATWNTSIPYSISLDVASPPAGARGVHLFGQSSASK